MNEVKDNKLLYKQLQINYFHKAEKEIKKKKKNLMRKLFYASMVANKNLKRC